jgi:hypothetical protein
MILAGETSIQRTPIPVPHCPGHFYFVELLCIYESTE